MTTCVHCGKKIPKTGIPRIDSRVKYCPDGCYREHKIAQERADRMAKNGGRHWTDPDECPQCHGVFVRTGQQQKVCKVCHDYNAKNKRKLDGSPMKNGQPHRRATITRVMYAKPGEGPTTCYVARNKISTKPDYDDSHFRVCACKRPFYGFGDKCPTCRGKSDIIRTVFNDTAKKVG
jgi:Zn-finger nucleic acid-binding protein